MNIYEKLAAVQQELKAPKDKYNSFGEYYYRSLEGINDAVKPILSKYKATIILSDKVVNIGGENIIEATAKFIDLDNQPETKWSADGITIATGMLEVTAQAGITSEKKKLDRSQLYGVASSYARKYAMNALLLIDDTKDPDTDEYQKQTGNDNTPQKAPETPEKPLSDAHRAIILELAKKADIDLSATGEDLDTMSDRRGLAMIAALKKRLGVGE